MKPLLGCFLLLLPCALVAEDLATAVFDADSYLFLGTSNADGPNLTINPHRAGESHFNFAVIRFELEGLPVDGRKFLSVHLPFFITGDYTTGFDTSGTGEAIVHVVALGGAYEQYLEPSVSKRAWYDLHLHGQPVIGTFHFRSVDGDGLGRYTIEVTAAVDAWLADPESNHGFGLWSESGSVDLSSIEGEPAHAPRLVRPPGLTYAAWLERHFDATERDHPGLADWTADPDQDGFGNGLEYRIGSDPRAAEEGAFWRFSNPKKAWERLLDQEAVDGTLVLESLAEDGSWTPLDPAAYELEADAVRFPVESVSAALVRLRATAP